MPKISSKTAEEYIVKAVKEVLEIEDEVVVKLSDDLKVLGLNDKIQIYEIFIELETITEKNLPDNKEALSCKTIQDLIDWLLENYK